jgi:hypothetical protein
VKIEAVPINREEARAFIASHHRHNKPITGYRFAVGASFRGNLVGVATCGTPNARLLTDGVTAEVTRCCVLPDAPRGACSFLYAACWRAWRAMGGRKLVTYTLQTESGASLRGAGARIVAELAPRSDAQQWTNRPGREFQPIVGQAKFRWEWAA